jgi:hypothetical protein
MPAQKFFVFCSCQLDFIFNGNEGWNLPPLMIRAFGAHGHKRT